MILTRNELSFYIAADRIMNGYRPNRSLIDRLKETLAVGGANAVVIRYLRHLWKYAYYYNTSSSSIWHKVMAVYEHYRLAKYAIKTGFTIGQNALSYGVVIPHYGTIVVNEKAIIGPFAVIHTSTCVAGGGKFIGEGFYLSSGSQLVGDITLGNNVTVAAHSLVNKSYGDNVLLVGSPAIVKRDNYESWYDRDGEEYIERVEQVKKLKLDMGIGCPI